MIPMDMHLHTNYSDGINSISEMVGCAVDNGIKTISFTDHMRADSDWFGGYYSEICNLQSKFKGLISILPGVECKLIDHLGNLDIPPAVPLDGSIRIVAAIHRIPTGNGYISANSHTMDMDFSKKMWLETIKGSVKNPQICCLAHPFSHLKGFGITADNNDFWERICEVLDNAKYEIEYNCKYDNTIVPEWVWKRYKDRVVFGSDSHSVEEMLSAIPTLYSSQIIR